MEVGNHRDGVDVAQLRTVVVASVVHLQPPACNSEASAPPKLLVAGSGPQ